MINAKLNSGCCLHLSFGHFAFQDGDGGSRTHTVRLLRPQPLPIGLHHRVSSHRWESNPHTPMFKIGRSASWRTVRFRNETSSVSSAFRIPNSAFPKAPGGNRTHAATMARSRAATTPQAQVPKSEISIPHSQFPEVPRRGIEPLLPT